MSEATWYTEITEGSSLEQGDIIEECKILIPDESGYNALLGNPDSEETLEMKYIEGNFIIMSKSCDLVNDKIESVILCPIISFRKVAEISPELVLKATKQKELLRKGNIPAYHLLEELLLKTTQVKDFYCVSFKHIYSVPKSYICRVIENTTHFRLLSPYKEHLSQSFARYFMRVGLPLDISKEKLKNYAIPNQA